MNMVADGSSSSRALCGARSGARLKRPWPTTRYSAGPCRPRSSITPISALRWPIRSDSGSVKAPAIGVNLRAPPIKRLRRRLTSLRPRRDLAGIVLHDPASTAFLPALINFKGYVALQAWRVSNWLWQQNRRDLGLLLQSESSDSLQVSIHPSASIGTAVFLDHATGVVIGSFVTIGDEVTILQNVTIGRNVETPNRARKIGRGVLLSTGNHSRRHQHRRLCQDRRGIGRDVRRAKRLYGGRCTRAPDQLPRTGSSLNPGSVAPNKLAQIPHPVTVRRHRRNPRR
jgi:Serine acetyltransferase, N-terminal